MKKYIPNIILTFLAAITAYLIIEQQFLIREVVQDTQKLGQQVDTLQTIFDQYEFTLTQLDDAYDQLKEIQEELEAIQRDFFISSRKREAELQAILQEVEHLKSPISIPHNYVTQSIDSLLFEP